MYLSFFEKYLFGSRKRAALSVVFVFLLFLVYPSVGQAAGERLDYIGPTSFDVSTAIHAGESEDFSVGVHEASPAGLAFSPDGLKMFVVGGAGDSVVEYALGTAWDVSTSVWAGLAEEFSVGLEESAPESLAFSSDGLKMFVIGTSGDSVVEYALGTAWDVSTSVWAGLGEEFDAGAEESSPYGLAFSTDGLKMFIIGTSDDSVAEYALGTAWDVSTAVWAGLAEEFYVGGEDSSPAGLAFTPDGLKMFIIGYEGDSVVEYALGTAWDVSTAVWAGLVEERIVTTEESSPRTLTFSPDGTKMFVLGTGDEDVTEYDIDPGDYAEATTNVGSIDNSSPLVIRLSNDTFQDVDADNLLDVGSEVTLINVPTGLTPVMTLSESDSVVTLTFTGNAAAHQNGDDLLSVFFLFDNTAFTGNDASVVVGSGSGSFQSSDVGIDFADNAYLSYVGPGSFDVSTAVHAGLAQELDISAEEATSEGLAFSSNGLKMFVVGADGDAVAEYSLGTAWDVSTAIHAGAFEEMDISGEEILARDVAFKADGTRMFVVGADGAAVVEYILGIAWDVSAAVHMGLGEELDVSGEEATPEGLAFSPDGLKMFVVGTTDASVAEYALGTAWDVSTAVHAGGGEEFDVSSEESQPKGIAFSPDGLKMFIVGPNGDSIVEYVLGTAWDVSTAVYSESTEELDISSEEADMTGIAFNKAGTKMFIIGYEGDSVVEYDIDPGNYAESSDNDGSIDSSTSLSVRLTGDTFQDVDADNLLDVGSEVTLANVPAGLTSVMTLSSSDTVVTLTFTGEATSNEDDDDVSAITFVFDDTAFTGGSAAAVIGSGSGSAQTSLVGIDFEDSSGGPSTVTPSGMSISVTVTPTCYAPITAQVQLSANDTSGYLIGNSISELGIEWIAFGASPVTVPWEFDSFGEHVVYAQFRSSSGHNSYPISQTVTVSETCPGAGGSGTESGDTEVVDIGEDEPSAAAESNGYDVEEIRLSTESINDDLGLETAEEVQGDVCVSGSLIKSPESSAVYYCGADGKRHAFPNAAVFHSWYDSFDDVVIVSVSEMALIPLGGNVTYRPGMRMVKIQSDPKVYAVTRGSVLRWVTSEAVAEALYGESWNQFIDDVNVAFFASYTIGEPITEEDAGIL